MADVSGKSTAVVNHMHQLFVDDFLIESANETKRVWHALERPLREPVLCPVMPWEGPRVLATGNVMRDTRDGLFKMWYLTGTANENDWLTRTLLCYAESKDGVRWERPPLGIHSFRGSRDNNIFAVPCVPEGTNWRFGPFSNTYNRDDSETPHKALGFSFNQWKGDRDIVHPSGTYLMTSPDGVHWTESEKPLWYLADGFGDGPRLTYDGPKKRYIGFLKVYEDREGRKLRRQKLAGMTKSFIKNGNDRWVELADNPDLVRRRAVTISQDLINWTEPEYILPLDDQDCPGDQTYTHAGWRYESMYLGLLTIYHLQPNEKWTIGTQHIEPIYSRDGVMWVRPKDRNVILHPGRLYTDWDQGAPFFFAHAQPIRVGHELYFYYNAHRLLHKIGPYDRGDTQFGAVGLAVLRVDGFASMDSGDGEGSLITKPLEMAGTRLYVNVDAFGGQMEVEARDAEGKALPGYSFDDSVPIRENAAASAVRWKSGERKSLEGRIVRLAFKLRNASLYSFWMMP